MTSIGEAARLHIRCDEALTYYRVYRNLWRWHDINGSTGRGARVFLLALSWRARWTVAQEIIDAELRRDARRAA